MRFIIQLSLRSENVAQRRTLTRPFSLDGEHVCLVKLKKTRIPRYNLRWLIGDTYCISQNCCYLIVSASPHTEFSFSATFTHSHTLWTQHQGQSGVMSLAKGLSIELHFSEK